MEFLTKHFIRSTIVLILLITVFGCSEDDPTPVSQTPSDDPTEEILGQPPISSGPEDSSNPIIGKKNIMIDNKANEVTGTPKKTIKDTPKKVYGLNQVFPGTKIQFLVTRVILRLKLFIQQIKLESNNIVFRYTE